MKSADIYGQKKRKVIKDKQFTDPKNVYHRKQKTLQNLKEKPQQKNKTTMQNQTAKLKSS